MKIAVVSEDEITVSQHFGIAPLYVVVTVEDGEVVGKETRPKAGHHVFTAMDRHEVAPGQPHGYDSGAHARHTSMAETIGDCQVLIAGGMGWGAYESLRSRNIETVVTDVQSIDQAVTLYLEGRLVNLMDRLH